MKSKLYISFISIILVILLFVVFPESLLFPIIDEPFVPLGTLVSWLGFISWSSFFLFLIISFHKPNKASLFVYSIKLFRALSFLWIFIVYALANNWSASFSGNAISFRGSDEASQVFWVINYALIAAPVLLYLILMISRFFKTK